MMAIKAFSRLPASGKVWTKEVAASNLLEGCYGTPSRHEGLSLSPSLFLVLSLFFFCCAFPLFPLPVVLSLFFLFLLCFLSSSFLSHTFSLPVFFCF
jgi:hypothetical protein